MGCAPRAATRTRARTRRLTCVVQREADEPERLNSAEVDVPDGMPPSPRERGEGAAVAVEAIRPEPPAARGRHRMPPVRHQTPHQRRIRTPHRLPIDQCVRSSLEIPWIRISHCRGARPSPQQKGVPCGVVRAQGGRSIGGGRGGVRAEERNARPTACRRPHAQGDLRGWTRARQRFGIPRPRVDHRAGAAGNALAAVVERRRLVRAARAIGHVRHRHQPEAIFAPVLREREGEGEGERGGGDGGGA